jgi:hypothetical protein
MPCKSGFEEKEPFDYKHYSDVMDKEVIALRKEIKRVKELSDLEKVAFNSFMSVFLCKTMDIVVSNFGYKYVNTDLEWWYKEHKFRDDNKNESELTTEEITKKLIEFETKYRVD